MPVNILSLIPATLTDLTDVSISNPQSAQYLRYNGSISKWQNASLDADIFGYISSSITGSAGVVVTNISGPQTTDISLSSINADVGTYGSASAIPVITVDAQGRISSVTTAISNFVVGTTTIYNTSYGDNSLINNVVDVPNDTGIGNVAVGVDSLTLNVAGYGNTALGTYALSSNVAGDFNTAVGYNSLAYTTGSNNVAIGSGSGFDITTGNNNVIIGGNTGGTIAGLDNNIIISDGSGNSRITVDGSGVVNITGTLLLTTDPVLPNEAATKQYVDNVAAGIDIHGACETSTTPASNIGPATYNNGTAGVGATLTSTSFSVLGTIGGHPTLAVTARLLVKDQTNSIENGVYTVTSLGEAGVSPWVLTRAPDFDGSPTTEIQAGDSTYIQQGTLAGTQWVQISVGTGMPGDYIIVGSDPINFTQFAGAGQYTAGTGISILSNEISNTGVTGIAAGTNISIDASTGLVTISVNGTVTSSVVSNNLSGGPAGAVPYQSSTNNTSMLAPGTTSQVMISGATPSWTNTPTLTGTNFTGIPNGGLINNSITLGSTTISLGSTVTSISGLSSVTATTFIGNFTGESTTAVTSTNLAGGAAGSVPYQTAPGATAMLPAGISTQVLVGGLTPAWTNTPTLTGTNFTGISNSSLLNSSITVNGVAISLGASGTVAAAAGTLTGTTLASGVTASSLTSVGTLSSLTVSGTINAQGRILVSNGSAGAPSIGWASDGVTDTGFYWGGDGYTSMTNNGAYSGQFGPGGTLTMVGTVTAPSFNATSTKRVKKSVKNLSKSYLDRFDKLKPREYDRTDYTAHEFGFIAEEMDKIYPEVVGKDEHNLPSGIDYGKLSTILIAKVQSQQKDIEQLQKQISKIMATFK